MLYCVGEFFAVSRECDGNGVLLSARQARGIRAGSEQVARGSVYCVLGSAAEFMEWSITSIDT